MTMLTALAGAFIYERRSYLDKTAAACTYPFVCLLLLLLLLLLFLGFLRRIDYWKVLEGLLGD